MSNPIEPASQTVTSAASSAKSGGGLLSGKRWIIALFIIAGLFFAYVLWQRSKTNTANATATTDLGNNASTADATAAQAGQLATLATLQEQLTNGQTATSSALSGISGQVTATNANVSGTRKDAAATNNTLNQIAALIPPKPKAVPAPGKPPAAIGKPAVPIAKVTPRPAPAPGKPPVTTPVTLSARAGNTVTPKGTATTTVNPVTAKYSHIASIV